MTAGTKKNLRNESSYGPGGLDSSGPEAYLGVMKQTGSTVTYEAGRFIFVHYGLRGVLRFSFHASTGTWLASRAHRNADWVSPETFKGVR